MICVRCIITGRVQGVFYRSSTREKAAALNLYGHVRNLSNGRVEVVASGNDASLKEFESWLWRGPMHAKVTNVSCELVDEQENQSLSAEVFDVL